MLQHHIQLGPEHLQGNGGVGRYVFLPGSRSRAERIAGHFSGLQTVDNPRGHVSYLGQLEGSPGEDPIDALSISTGMGSPSVEVIVHELLQCGARRLLRVGSCGTLSPRVPLGSVVIATAAVRDEGTSRHFAPLEFPAVAHPRVVAALVEGAATTGLADRSFLGIVHSKDSLYAREFGLGPAAKQNKEYMEWIARAGAIASEMEAAALFVMASGTQNPSPISARDPESIQVGCVLGVFGDGTSMRLDETLAETAERRAITVAVEGVRSWARTDRGI